MYVLGGPEQRRRSRREEGRTQADRQTGPDKRAKQSKGWQNSPGRLVLFSRGREQLLPSDKQRGPRGACLIACWVVLLWLLYI